MKTVLTIPTAAAAIMVSYVGAQARDNASAKAASVQEQGLEGRSSARCSDEGLFDMSDNGRVVGCADPLSSQMKAPIFPEPDFNSGP
ncbi:hypothetical protein [Beijerinckia sp. L45]|uniref:hypothetical protein n=1 Tax=Beijerinckia sp. L45 TaxID=1641855 RepID=UPI00131B2705|nr:hypothetical protein [Beijerinckia sp. L45]